MGVGNCCRVTIGHVLIDAEATRRHALRIVVDPQSCRDPAHLSLAHNAVLEFYIGRTVSSSGAQGVFHLAAVIRMNAIHPCVLGGFEGGAIKAENAAHRVADASRSVAQIAVETADLAKLFRHAPELARNGVSMAFAHWAARPLERRASHNYGFMGHERPSAKLV